MGVDVSLNFLLILEDLGIEKYMKGRYLRFEGLRINQSRKNVAMLPSIVSGKMKKGGNKPYSKILKRYLLSYR